MVLGSIEFLAADDRPIDLMSQAQRRLVAVLGLHANSTVPAGALEELLVLSPGALRTSISRLRRVVGGGCLMTGPTGYELRATIDATDFERGVNDALARSDASARLSLELALALWRGQPYREFAHEAWAVGEVVRLSDVWASAVEELAVLMLRDGQQVAAVAMLETLIAAEPYRDRPRALLIRALAEDGRRTEALRAFQAYRSVLLDDIGIEPSSDLVRLDQAIAASIDLEELRREGNMAWGRQRRHPVPVSTLTAPDIPAPDIPAPDIPAPSATLLGTRAVQAFAGLVLDREAIRAVVSICAALDDLPLALELAAARLRASTLRGVAHNVTELLGREAAALPAHDGHATPRATIEWSVDLVDPDDQRVTTSRSRCSRFRSPLTPPGRSRRTIRRGPA